MAGYQKQMERNLFRANEGFDRRFRLQFVLQNLSPQLLRDIVVNTARDKGMEFGPRDQETLLRLIRQYNAPPHNVFPNQGGDAEAMGENIAETAAASVRPWRTDGNDEVLEQIFQNRARILQTRRSRLAF